MPQTATQTAQAPTQISKQSRPAFATESRRVLPHGLGEVLVRRDAEGFLVDIRRIDTPSSS